VIESVEELVKQKSYARYRQSSLKVY